MKLILKSIMMMAVFNLKIIIYNIIKTVFIPYMKLIIMNKFLEKIPFLINF